MSENYKNTSNCPRGSFEYTIKSGDTLFKLAQTYNTTVDAIMKLNPGINPNNLQIGQRICIPQAGTPPSTRCPVGTFAYTIKSGDTLYLLAIRFNTTVAAIMAVNPGINPNNLQIGQVICIPESSTVPPPPRCPVGTFAYVIKAGDTLYMLAITYNTTVAAIMAVNPGINPNNLQIGQIICIPEEMPPSRCPMGTFEYTIKPGDTLYMLAQKYNTTVSAILAVNPGLDPNNLRVGQIICIPEEMPSRCPMGTFEYTIKPGDTLYMLAIKYNTTVAAILAVNPGLDPNNLRVGQIICIPEEMPSRCPMGTFEYTIKPGDTLYMLAQKYNTTVAAILAVNPGLDPNNLRVGQIICIPEEMPSRCPMGTFEYTIKPGDTLYMLAQKYDTTVAAILAVNPGLDPNNLRVGQIICIPEEMPSRCPMGTFEYTIKPGDTLYMLAQKYNTTVAAILAVNPGLDPNNLRVGQIICIPKSVTPPPECDGIYYVVRAGDTLYSIANLFNISVAKLIAANPGIDPNNLQIGQIICIPKDVPVTCPGGFIYTVGANDTVGSIQLKFDISIMDLMAGNPNVNWDKLMPGQELCILPHKDRGCPCMAGTKSYVILPADMQPNKSILECVAKKFNTTVSTLLKINPNLAPNDFVVGARICVPKN